MKSSCNQILKKIKCNRKEIINDANDWNEFKKEEDLIFPKGYGPKIWQPRETQMARSSTVLQERTLLMRNLKIKKLRGKLNNT